MVSIRVWVGCVVTVVSVRGRTGSATFSLSTLELVEFVAGKHGKRRDLATASRAASRMPKFAVRVAVITLLVANLPTQLPVLDLTRFCGSRSNSRSSSVSRGAASGLATRNLFVFGVSAALLWVGVNANVTSQFIASAETLFAPRMCADVGLLASVSADVSGLVFETVESARTERTLVWSRDLGFVDGVTASCEGSGVGAGIGHVSGSGLSHCESAI